MTALGLGAWGLGLEPGKTIAAKKSGSELPHSKGQEPYRGIEEKLPLAVAPQPIAFSHKVHAAQDMECADCHGDAREGERAGIPQWDVCLLCHDPDDSPSSEIRKLADYRESGARIPWVRVYKLPDYVFFSHASHLKPNESRAARATTFQVVIPSSHSRAPRGTTFKVVISSSQSRAGMLVPRRGSECRTCHGEVAVRDVLLKEVSTSMVQCMECHQESGASTECSLCHELGA